jgi:3-oxoacyl-[acyl-carrier protein] reductase
MDLGLKDQVALVTAASRGLGKAAARQFALEGARVAICARSEAVHLAAKEIRDECGCEVLAVQADVSDQSQVDDLVRKTLDHFGQIDILIINAGGPALGGFLDLGPEDWRRASDLTLMSAVYLAYAVVPHMLERGAGSIVATESLSVKQPIDKLILSNSVRLAVIGMMKSLANELGPRGIRVNSINPGWTWTERVQEIMASRAAQHGSSVEEEVAKVVQGIPLGRMASMEEYGRAIVWLASPAASYIHGHALMFDGGATSSPL